MNVGICICLRYFVMVLRVVGNILDFGYIILIIMNIWL